MDAHYSAAAIVAGVLNALGARAAGLWAVAGDQLVQEAFAACADMPGDVAHGFAAATRSVALSEVSLGIVTAARSGAPCVSRAAELPADAGSGRWLRAFGAERSIAVPLADEHGRVAAVLSVALLPTGEPDESVAQRVREAGSTLFGPCPPPTTGSTDPRGSRRSS